MMLVINNRIRIAKDGENLLLQIKKISTDKKNGNQKENWKTYGYYGKLESALIGAFMLCTAEEVEEEHTLQTIIEKLDYIKEDIVNAVR